MAVHTPRSFARSGVVGAILLAITIGVAVVLTRATHLIWPRRVYTWIATASRPVTSMPTNADATLPNEPPYSDISFDDSGYATAIRFSLPVTDPASLAQMRESVKGRGQRGIEYLQAKLITASKDTAAPPELAKQLYLLLGSLHMYEGQWSEASAAFARAQSVDPGRAPGFRANMDALRGVAALRRGEIENCVACCNESSCIFPLGPAAVHQQEAGSREAIEHFTRYLKQRPEDLGVRWLLNVAYMTLGEYPASVPPEFVLPLGRFASPPVSPERMPNVATKVGLNIRGESMAGGCVIDDFDNDGLLDVFMPSTDPDRGASLLRNRGDGHFEDVSDKAGLAAQVLSLNAYHADFDNDGKLDILMLRGAWETPRRMSLLHNKGGTFEDVTLAAGLGEPISSQAAGWADFDNDGLVDLYVAGEFDAARPDPRNKGRLYRNKGNGRFEDVAAAAGVTNDRFGKGVAWGDYDDDGFPDLYVANLGPLNRLYHNRGDGTFVDAAPILKVTEPVKSFACWFWDFDNDGRLDLWVNPNDATLSQVIKDQLGQPTAGETPRLYRNTGETERFKDVTKEVGLNRVVLPMGSNFGDVDNDGFLDIYLGTGRPSYSYLMPNVLFRNNGGKQFEDITANTGTGHLQKGHGVAFADWDNDGDQDLFLQAGGAVPGDRAHNVLFQNPGHGNHWITIKLVGTKSNRAALGAKIKLTLPAATPEGRPVERHRTITTGSSFGANPLACTIGLGRADRILSVEVYWPTSKTRQTFADVPVDGFIEITEGRNAFRKVDRKPIALR